MHIAICMFSKGGGGIEQAFIDYCEGLQRRGHQISAIIHPGAVVESQIVALGITPHHVRNMGEWDIFAAARLKKLLLTLQPEIVIAGCNRSLMLNKRAIKGAIPLVGITHNYSTARQAHADASFAITDDLKKHLIQQGIDEERIFRVPNMVRCQALPTRPARRSPVVIGSMGRFVTKKGFDVYIDALHILHKRGIAFKAVLGGTGAEESALKAQASEAGLQDALQFIGWVGDKKQFFHDIDIFCLPSLHEPFGIVLLEAFMHGVPVVSSDSEGPTDIITPNYDALLAKKGDASSLADALAHLLEEEKFSANLATNAFVKTKTVFDMDVVAERIEQACQTIIWRYGK